MSHLTSRLGVLHCSGSDPARFGIVLPDPGRFCPAPPARNTPIALQRPPWYLRQQSVRAASRVRGPRSVSVMSACCSRVTTSLWVLVTCENACFSVNVSLIFFLFIHPRADAAYDYANTSSTQLDELLKFLWILINLYFIV